MCNPKRNIYIYNPLPRLRDHCGRRGRESVHDRDDKETLSSRHSRAAIYMNSQQCDGIHKTGVSLRETKSQQGERRQVHNPNTSHGEVIGN